MPRHVVFLPHEQFSPAELSAARLDGHLVELGEGYLPADAVETSATRAASLRSLLGDRLAAVLDSAAWVHGVLPAPPARHFVSRSDERRVPSLFDRRASYVDVTLSAGEVWCLAGVHLTSPARTLADLARYAHDESRARAARSLVEAGLASPAEALACLRARRRLPHGGRPAVAFLRALDAPAGTAQAEVTRYTS